ncbi:MAG: acyloxyacyl hydrolase [Crocinitomicaceae bacterium]|nr:acyloxyacyl hydrolase [Crocinitomicaceae bacterium]
MEHLITGHSYGGFAQLTTRARGGEYWKFAYSFPDCGFDLFYNFSGNQKMLGSQWALSYFCLLPLNRKRENTTGEFFSIQAKRFRHWIGLGLGAGYSTKKWDLRENHQAAVLGSRINAVLTLQYTVRLLSFKKSELRGGLRITHFSNGAFQVPNLGTNNAALFLGVSFLPERKKDSEEEVLRLPRDLKEPLTLWKTTLTTSVGMKEIPPPGGKKYLAYSVLFLQEKRISYKSSVGVGLDVIYNTSIPVLMERFDRSPRTVLPRIGAAISYSLHFNHLEFKMQQGIYVVDQWKGDGAFYHRFGLRYGISRHFFVQLMLKTHFAKADYGETGVGYYF